jgi:hypothetical protein
MMEQEGKILGELFDGYLMEIDALKFLCESAVL